MPGRNGTRRAVVIVGSQATRVRLRKAFDTVKLPVAAEADTVKNLRLGRSPVDLVAVIGPTPGRMASRNVTEMRHLVPGILVVVLASSMSDIEFLSAMQAGAVGYLPVKLAPGKVATAVSAVFDGEVAVPRRLVARLVSEFTGGSRRVIIDLDLDLDAGEGAEVELSDRQWEVTCLLRQGLSTREIAERLFVSPATVRSHIAAVVRKLGASDRADALRLLSGS